MHLMMMTYGLVTESSSNSIFFIKGCPPKLVFGRPVDFLLEYCHIEF